MARKALIGDVDIWFALIGLAWCINYVTAKWWGYPYLYCWFGPTVRHAYEAFGNLMFLITLAGFAVNLFKRDWLASIFSAGIMIMILNVPTAADTVFRLGGSCG
ncbi:MAG: hypothetical protein J0I79_16365 [Mesorhizobium sp.]|uniref:hypothetical protein n=1 Tax=Mesorhizobium sp. TaxID=1871066 RepID=UPI001AD25EC5|nr:hypothetical protein [Mesorhizobium sp.]MBN9219520.1 hypothetical protein [Mesorhizobium sp.]